MLPVAARQHFLEHGYALVQDVIPQNVVSSLRESSRKAALDRLQYFANWPSMESLFQNSTPKPSDPLYDTFSSYLKKRKVLAEYAKLVKRRRRQSAKLAKKILAGRDIRSLSEEELREVSQLVVMETNKPFGKGCTSTVDNDSQLLSAINEYRANLWMTNSTLKEIIQDRKTFSLPIGELLEFVGGVERPVLFGDAPYLRQSFGNPVGYQCAAPLIGTRTNTKVKGTSSSEVAVSAFIFTQKPSEYYFKPYVLRNSHHVVRKQYGSRVKPAELALHFLPMEAHIPQQLKHFTFGEAVEGVPIDCDRIGPGTVLIADPHLMLGFGPNMTRTDEVLYRMNFVHERASPSTKPPSWVRGWRSSPRDISFAAPVVFPRFY